MTEEDVDYIEPSDEFKALALVLQNDTKRSRNVLLIAILVPSILIGITLASLYIQVQTSGDIAKDAKVTADFVRNCFNTYTPRCPISTTTTTVP